MNHILDSMDVEALLRLFIKVKANAESGAIDEIVQAIELKTGFNILSASEREIKVLFERFKLGSSSVLYGLDINPEKIKEIEDRALSKINQKDG